MRGRGSPASSGAPEPGAVEAVARMVAHSPRSRHRVTHTPAAHSSAAGTEVSCQVHTGGWTPARAAASSCWATTPGSSASETVSSCPARSPLAETTCRTQVPGSEAATTMCMGFIMGRGSDSGGPLRRASAPPGLCGGQVFMRSAANGGRNRRTRHGSPEDSPGGEHLTRRRAPHPAASTSRAWAYLRARRARVSSSRRAVRAGSVLSSRSACFTARARGWAATRR